MNEYAAGAGRNTPAALRDKVYSNGNEGLFMAHLVLVREATAQVDDPGRVTLYHHAGRYTPLLGRPASPFDNEGFSFIQVKATLDNTTQSARIVNHIPMMRHLAARFRWLRYPRLRETVACDTVFSSVPSLRNRYTGVSLF